MNPFFVPSLEEAAKYEKALELLGSGHRAAEICALTGLPGDTVRGICADPRGTRAAITRARAPKPAVPVKVSERAAVDAAVRVAGAASGTLALEKGRSVDSVTSYPPPVRGVPEPLTRDDEAPVPVPAAASVALPGASIVHLPSQTARLLLERASRLGMLVADLIADLQKALADAGVSEREPERAVVEKPAPRPRNYTPEGKARMRANGLRNAHRRGHHENAIADCPDCIDADERIRTSA